MAASCDGSRGVSSPPQPSTVENLRGEIIKLTQLGETSIDLLHFENYYNEPLDFIGLFKVHDEDGVTIFLSRQNSTIATPELDTGLTAVRTVGVLVPDEPFTQKLTTGKKVNTICHSPLTV